MSRYAEEELALVFIEEVGTALFDLSNTIEQIPGVPAARIAELQAQQAYLVKLKAALNEVLPASRRAEIKAYVAGLIG